MRRRCFSVFTLLLALWWSQPCLAGSSEYDGLFRYSSARFLAWHDPDWGWLKAQGIAESNLDPEAVSRVGAQGIMQFMPGTFADCAKALRFGPTSRFSPKASIICGGWYMNQMLRSWTAERSRMDRWRWSWASYNWGIGNMLNLQRKLDGATEYLGVEGRLPQETRDYVRRIERIRSRGQPAVAGKAQGAH